MPKRPEDPSLLGFVIAFDPWEEERRLQEEKELKRLAKKAKKRKKNDSSICSGATESTSKNESNNSNGPLTMVPDKIVTHIVVDEDIIQPTSSTDEMDNTPPSSEAEEQVTAVPAMEKEGNQKSKAKQSGKSKKSKTKDKEAKSKKQAKKKAKKQAKSLAKKERRQKLAACNIQRVARGYLVRRDLTTEREDSPQTHEQEEVSSPDTTPAVAGPLTSQSLARGRRKGDGPSRVQRVFRLHNMRRLFKRGDKDRWRNAWRQFVVFGLLRPTMEGIRKKRNLMEAHPSVHHDDDNDEEGNGSSTRTSDPEPPAGLGDSGTTSLKKNQSPYLRRRTMPLSVVAVALQMIALLVVVVGKADSFALVPVWRPQMKQHVVSTVMATRFSLNVLHESPNTLPSNGGDADKKKPALQQSNAQSFGNQEGGDSNDDAFRNDAYEVQVTPEVQQLIARLTENYVFAKEDGRAAMVDEVLALVESDFKVRQVPVQIGQTIFDAATTGIPMDQSVAEILSFAAYHGLPSRLTAELLDESLGDAFATAKKIFVEQGWNAVFFPQGLGIQPRRQKRRWRWTKRKQARIAEAIQAVRAAAAARNPVRQLSSQKEFLAKLVAGEYTKATDVTLSQKNMPFFPQNLPLPSLSWRRLRRSVEQASSKIRQKGKAGILAFAVFNFCLYSVGMLWQWRTIAAAEVTSASNAAALTLRKFGRVFGTIYIISNLLKFPKLLTVAGLSPFTGRFLQWAQSKTELSETRLLTLCLTTLVAVWLALLAGPLVSDYSRIRRLIFLETLLYDQYTITRPAMVISTA